MRTFLILLVAAALGVLFYHQKHRQPEAIEIKAVVNSQPPRPGQPIQPAQPAAAETHTQPRPVSEHNWMKRSLDRATDVRNQARAQTQESQNP